jgi:3-hydroxyisobutyryl-CoA hydrolase
MQYLFVSYSFLKFQHDFREGVSAFFAKRTPQWQPSKLEDVDLESYIRGNLFGFQHETRRAYFTSDEDYIAYPFFRFGLPSVEEIQAVQKKYNLKSMSEVESWFLIEHQGKFGVRQRVQQVLEEDQYQKR